MLTKVVNGVDFVLSAEDETALLVEWDENLVLSTEDRRITGIKNEANTRIINLLPLSTQENFLIRENNLQARISYLQRKEYGSTATIEEVAELDIAEAMWIKIEDIRVMSDLAETNGDLLVTFQAALDLKGY